MRVGDSSSQLHVVRLTRRARGRRLRRLASALQGSRDALRAALGLRQTGLRDVLPDDSQGHDYVRNQAKRERLPRAPAQGRAGIPELVLECL